MRGGWKKTQHYNWITYRQKKPWLCTAVSNLFQNYGMIVSSLNCHSIQTIAITKIFPAFMDNSYQSNCNRWMWSAHLFCMVTPSLYAVLREKQCLVIPRNGWLDRVVELNSRVSTHEISQRTVEDMKCFAHSSQLVVFLHSKPSIILIVVTLFIHC